MSRQTGLIKLKGKMDGISFYSRDGEAFARMARGPSKEKILNSPAFRRTRENMTEFGGAATVGKSLRLALGGRMVNADAKLVARLQKVFKQVCLYGTGVRGERSIELVNNPDLVENFEFNTGTSFTSVFNAPYSIQTTAARDEATFAAASFLPSVYVNAPQGATHFRVFTVLCALSDYTYDPVTRHYTATDPTLDMLSKDEESPITDLNTALPVSISLNPVLPGSPAMMATTAAVLIVGCEFFQRIGVDDYLLAQGNCMRVIKVF
jgi:hypothetical protein